MRRGSWLRKVYQNASIAPCSNTLFRQAIETHRQCAKLARREASSGEQMDQPEVSEAVIFSAREEVLKLHMSDAVEEYIVQLIMATRQPAASRTGSTVL